MSEEEQEIKQPKWRFKFDKDEKSFIHYRLVSKAEAMAHLANYVDQKNILDSNISHWTAVVDYEESKESKDE